MPHQCQYRIAHGVQPLYCCPNLRSSYTNAASMSIPHRARRTTLAWHRKAVLCQGPIIAKTARVVRAGPLYRTPPPGASGTPGWRCGAPWVGARVAGQRDATRGRATAQHGRAHPGHGRARQGGARWTLELGLPAGCADLHRVGHWVAPISTAWAIGLRRSPPRGPLGCADLHRVGR